MVSASELRYRARQSLSGNWGTAILAILIYSIITSILSAVTAGIGSIIISGPLSLGLFILFLNIIRKKNADVELLFEGFKNFPKAFLLNLLMTIYILLWFFVFIIPGIIKSFSYSMSFYILADNPNISANEAITESRKIMDGNKFNLFILNLSFIGWIFLSILTLGIGLLWIIPYIQCANAQFYQEIKGEYTDIDIANAVN